MFWLRLAQEELEEVLYLAANPRAGASQRLLLRAKQALQRAAKELLYTGNDPVGFRRDMAVM